VISDMSQYWTVVVVNNGHYECKNHFGSFSADSAKTEFENLSPAGTSVVALVPGRHAQNSHSFDILLGTTCSVESRFIDPFEMSSDCASAKI